MTKVRIDPGICGLKTIVEAQADEDNCVTLNITSDCGTIRKLKEAMEEEYDAYDVCMQKPGTGPLYDIAREGRLPLHASCPVINGIIKCVEAECRLALKKNAAIEFID